MSTSHAASPEEPHRDESGIAAEPWRRFSGPRRYGLLAVLFLVGTSNYVDKNIVGVLLEQIKQEFGVSDTLLGLLSGLSFALLYATLGIPVARLADVGNRKIVISFSLTVWSVMTALCGVATSFWQLVAARFGVGAGEAGAIPPAQSLIADYFPPEQRSRAIGIFMTSSAVGYAVGLILGGLVAEVYGWRVAFILVGLFGLVLAPISHFALVEPRTKRPSLTAGGGEGMISATRALLRKGAYRNILCAATVHWFVSYGALVFIVSVLMRGHGLSVSQAGGMFGTISAGAAVVGSIGGGFLADKLAARDSRWLPRLTGGGMILAVPLFLAGLASSSLLPLGVLLFVGMMLLTAILPPLFAALHLVCGSSRRALSVAVLLFVANLVGLGLGPIATGALSDWLAQRYGSADGLRYAVMLVLLSPLLGGLLMLRVSRTIVADAEA